MSDLISVKRWAKLSDWNPLSPLQVMAYLKRMKYPIPKHRTERDEQGERKATTNDESLSDLFQKTQDPVLGKVLEIRHTSKALAYLSDRYVYSDGRLHPIYTMKPKQRLSCVPTDHQILTARGWSSVEELRVGEPVASWVGGKLVWVPLLAVHRGSAVVGELIVGRSWRTDFRCTAEHKWLTEEGELVEAQALKPGARIRLAAAGLEGELDRKDWQAALVGWALTDGSIIRTTKGTAALQIQVRKPTTIAALDALLATVPHTRTDALNSRYRYVRFYVGTRVFGPLWQEVEDAGVTAWLLALPTSGKRAAWAAMMEADGSYDEQHGERFGKQRRDSLDAYQALAVALGKQTITSQRAAKESAPAGYEACFTDVTVRPEQILRAAFVHGSEEEAVWCPETPTGNWVCRSGSSVGITGNSAKPNVMNFPKGKKGEVLKRAADAVLSSIIADDGWVLFSCDWNSLHPALIAYFAQDPGYARIARLGDHAYVLSHFLGKPVNLERPDEEVKADLEALKEANPQAYKTCKIGNLAYKYLQGEVNMARTLGLTLEETRRIRTAIDKASPKVAAWKWSVLEQAHFQGKLVTCFGLPLTFFDIFKTKGGKVMMRDGKPMLGSEAPEAVAFMPLGTESGMLREVLVDLGTHPEHEDSFQLLMPEHDKVIGQIKEDQVDRVLREIIVPSMGREWGELGGLKVGVDVEVGRRLQECKCKSKPCEAGHMVPWRQGT